MERFAGNLENKFGPRVELRDHGKIAVVARARLGGQALSNFRLDDEMHFVDDGGEAEEVMQNGRSNVVGKIAVNADAPAGSEGGKVGLENVAGDDGEPGELFREATKDTGESWIQLDGANRATNREQVARHFTVAGADFDPAVRIVFGQRDSGMRGDSDGTGDLFAPVEVRKKMLAEPLARHRWNSVAVAAMIPESC